MTFDESFKPYKLTEATGDNSYSAMMKVQEYIENTLGWDIIDCQQDDEDLHMIIEYT